VTLCSALRAWCRRWLDVWIEKHELSSLSEPDDKEGT